MLDIEKFNIGHYKNLYKSIKLDIKFKNSLSQISSNLITPPPTLDLRPWLPPLIPDLKPWTPKEPEPQPLTCNCIWTVLLFMEYNAKKNCKYNKPLSRDFLHKNAIYDKPGKKGWTNIALMDSAVKYGTVPEEVYPNSANLKMTPEMYKLALNFKIDSYNELDHTSVNEMKSIIIKLKVLAVMTGAVRIKSYFSPQSHLEKLLAQHGVCSESLPFGFINFSGKNDPSLLDLAYLDYDTF
jgi:hypothetical protein